jgi:hypothetical protein
MEQSSSHSLRWPWVLVVACGLLLGYYVLQTYDTPLHRQYQLDFGKAQWIEPAESFAPIAYFRKEVYLNALPKQAWIQIAASDNFGLIVNGHTVGNLGSEKTYETGIYDFKRALKVGTNVIAVSISRTSYPGTAQLLLSGQITESGGNVSTILSDQSWRVSNRKGIVPGSEEWDSVHVEDEVWPRAHLSELNRKAPPLRWVDTDPRLLRLPVIGYWIMAENAARQAVFSTTIRADRSKQETWIQVASSGDLDLSVNGHIITASTEIPVGGKKLPHLATAEPTPREVNKAGGVINPTQSSSPQKGNPFQTETLAAYDISYWIEKGQNVIVAAVRSEHIPASFLANGYLVNKDNSISRFASNSAWRVGDRPGANSSAVQRTVQTGPDGVAPWGYLPQELARPLDRSGFATFFKSCLVVVLTLAAVIGLWLVVSAIVSSVRREPLTASLSRDALLHGPIAVGLLLLLLPNYDPRFPDGWSFQPQFVVGAFAVLLLVRLLYLAVDSRTPAATRSALAKANAGARWESLKSASRNVVTTKLRLPQLFEIPFRQLLPYLLLILIMFLGLGLRYHNLGDMSFDHDEMGLVAKSKGIYKLGFPYTAFASEVRWITTYEAVPYPLALSGLFFGYSEWSMRLPACIMGTLSIGVIALMGRRLFDWRTGLFTALIYACMPLNIRWAQNAFYLSQCQLMTLVTCWFFYEAIRIRPFHRKFLTAAAVAFCCSYLSWEGTGFLLPAFGMGLLVVRWGQWWWLKEFHLYRCLFFMGAVVVAQYCSRLLAGVPYLNVGSGISNLTGPSLFFLAPGYQPMFYVDKLLLSENHVFFTLMILVGLPFCWKHLGFRYVIVLLTTLFILHTNFLAALSPRYCYYYQPFVLMGGIAAAVMLYDKVLAVALRSGNSLVARFAAHATGVALLALLFVQSNESVLQEYELSSVPDTPEMMTRMNTYRYDYRGVAHYVTSHARPGDVIFPGIPHVFKFYAGFPGDYFLDTLYSSKVPYDPTLSEPKFADKFGELPVVRDVTELKEVVHRSGRAWIVFAPYATFEKFNSPAALDFIHEYSKIEFESYRVKVLLIEGAQPGSTVARTIQTAE